MTKNKTGTPLIPIDWDLVELWCKAGAKGTSIAAKLGIHPDTLYERVVKKHPEFPTFSAYRASKIEAGDDDLRVKIYNDALKVDDKISGIWLSKQRLGYKERHEQSTPDGGLDINVTIRKGEEQ